MTISQKLGLFSCVVIIISCFLNWAWYPDIQKYFTAFFSEQNYYGKPGKVLLFFAITGGIFFYINKPWSQRINLFFGALCVAYAIKTCLLFTSGYDGFVPVPQVGLFIMLAASLIYVIAAALSLTMVKQSVPIQKENTPDADVASPASEPVA